MNILNIDNLTVKVAGKTILKDFSLEIKSGEIHAIMGPNGTGKSTLTKVIMGDPNYEIVKGTISYNGKVINDMPVNERAKIGIFLGMQMPMAIEGVTNADFLRSALRAKEGNKFKLLPFIREVDELTKKLHMDPDMIHRGINDGFSGGERKKNEILQMNILKPDVVLLDEIDSGLDVDSLKLVGQAIMDYYKDRKPAILLVTHYQRLLDYIKPDFIHIMKDGKIVLSGDKTLALKIEEEGYDKLVGDNNE
ncbi:aBC transporter ATP-binding protein [Firmicutes bacterium CAG:822]|nr:aBC transporter ATP-binding protein [Firmicutes bacterium CAG:822]